MNRYAPVIALCLLISACGSKKDGILEEPSVTSYENSNEPKQLAEDFANAIIQNDESLLEPYQVTESIVRFMVPPKPGQDTELAVHEMLEPMKMRLKDNLMNIQSQIDVNEVDRAKLSYKEYIYHDEGQNPQIPKVLEVVLDNDGSDVNIPITITEIHGKWYLFEILNSMGLFD